MTQDETPTPNAPALAGARCAVHVDSAAQAICSRCGSYTCEVCNGNGQWADCLACRSRSGAMGDFPFTRDAWTIDGLLSFSLERFRQQWLMLCVVGVIFLGAIYSIAFAGAFGSLYLQDSHPEASLAVSVGGQVLQVIVQLGLQLGFFAILFDTLKGKPVQLGLLFGRLHRMPTMVLQMLIIYAVMLLFVAPSAVLVVLGSQLDMTALYWAGGAWIVLAIAPMIYLGLGILFAQMHIVYEPSATAMSGLRDAYHLVSGQRWPVLGASIVAGVIGLVGVLACCIGLVASMQVGSLMFAGLYLALRTETPQAPQTEL